MKGLIFTYLVTYGGAIVALFSPFYGLLAYVCFAIMKPDQMWPWSVSPGNYSRIIAVAMMIGWSYSNRATFRMGKAWSVFLFLIAFWVWSIIGALMAPNQVLAWAYVDILTKIVIPVFIGLTTIDSTDKLKKLAWVIVSSQGYIALELNMYYFQGINVLQFEGFGGLDNNSAAIAIVTALGVAFFLGLHSSKLWQKGVAFGIAALLAHAVLFSFSRGGMLAMALTGCVAFLLIPKQPKHYFVFALALLFAARLAGPEVRSRFLTSFGNEDSLEASAQSRVDLWRDCWDVMKNRPVFGVGPNHWPLIAPKYGWPLGKEAHSLWVQTGAELGFLGMFLLLGFYGLCMIRLWPLARQKCEVTDPWYSYSARMVIASLVGFMVAAQFVSLEALEVPYYVALLGAATLKLASQRESEGVSQQTECLEVSDMNPGDMSTPSTDRLVAAHT